MTFKPFAAGFCAVAALSAGTGAFAQAAAPAAAPAGPPLSHGPAAAQRLPDRSVDQVVAASTVGKYVQTPSAADPGPGERRSERRRTPQLNTDAKALDGQRATLDQTTFEQRATAIQVRNNALQRKVQQRERELQMTEQKALGRVVQESEQPVRQAYQQKGCSILLQHQAVLGVFFNPAMDISPQVVTALNAKVQQFAFDRERLDQAAPTAAVGGAPPIVQTPPGAARPPVKK